MKNGPVTELIKSRSQMTAFLSADDGTKWGSGMMLDERNDVYYPDGFQAPSGEIVISYDRNRAKDREILMARFTEADIRAGKLVTANSATKMIVSKAMRGLVGSP